MAFKLKHLFARGPEAIDVEKVFIRDIPLEELGLTLLFILVAGFWLVFSGDVVDWIMGVEINSPTVHTLRAINFVSTTSLVLYLVLRRTLRRRRQAEEALRLSQQRFESVALATTDAIWDLNLETKVVWWSEGIEKLFGYRSEDVSSKFDWWLQRVHPDDRDIVTESIRKVVESGGKTWGGEYRFKRQDEHYATVLDRGFIIRDSRGKPMRLVGGLSDVSEQRIAEKALENSRQQLRALTARLQSGREDERTKVAREIHDDLGQVLTALKLNLDWLERKIAESGEGSAQLNPLLDRIVESSEMAESAIQSVQRIATDLRPAALDNLGLVEALQEEARRFELRSGVSCKLRLPAERLGLLPETSTAIFRVFQEALTNVARHADATGVRISLETHDGQVLLQLEDNGRGIGVEALGDPHSLGLLGMTERASALGGHVAIAPVIPHGTRVTLQLPLKADTEKVSTQL
jgi:two-component system sensor histidine kinase UhpB